MEGWHRVSLVPYDTPWPHRRSTTWNHREFLKNRPSNLHDSHGSAVSVDNVSQPAHATCHSTVTTSITLQPAHSRSTAIAQPKHSRSTAEAQPKHSRSTAEAQPKHSRRGLVHIKYRACVHKVRRTRPRDYVVDRRRRLY